MEIGEPSAADAKEGAAKEAGDSPPHRCVQDVTLHHGAGFTSQRVTQYVNLPREGRFINAPLGRPNLDRLSRSVRVRVSLSDRQTGPCLMRFVAAGPEHARYTDTERERDRDFKVFVGEVEQTNFDENSDDNWTRVSVENGDATIETQINVAGGNEFRLEAKCSVCGTSVRGTVLRCGPLVIKRRIWVLPIAMERPSAPPPHFASIEEELARCHLEVRFLPLQTMRYYCPIVPSVWWESSEFMSAAQQAARDYWSSGNHVDVDPYVITMLLVDQIGTKLDLPIMLTVEGFDRPAPGDTTAVAVRHGGQSRLLWRDHHPDANDNSDWLFEATYISGNQRLDLSHHCRPSEDHGSVLIDTIAGVFDNRQYVGDPNGPAPGQIRLRVHVVQSWQGGLARSADWLEWWHGRHGETTIPTRAQYQVRTGAAVCHAIAHEVGHLLGLVPDGTVERGRLARASNLDRSPMWYVGHGHNGPHCSFGIRTDARPALPEDLDARGRRLQGHCIMYGGYPSDSHFCPHCTSAVRKQNLDEGWASFE